MGSVPSTEGSSRKSNDKDRNQPDGWLDSSVVALVVLVIGLIVIVAGFLKCAYGGSLYLFVAGVIIAVAGIVLSYMDLRGTFTYVISKEPVGRKGGRR